MSMSRIILNETSYFGPGCRSAIPAEVIKRGFKKALLVTDKELVKYGVAKMVTAVLDEAGLIYSIYDDIKANPTIQNVQNGVEAFKAAEADYIIAVGGGSPMDTAKGIGIIINNPDFYDVVSLAGLSPTTHKSVPIIAVTTTAGTASEVTINYVITDESVPVKMVCVDPNDLPIIAIVDPELMISKPKGLTAATGMDALTHAIEGYITKGGWEMSDMFALKSIELIADNLKNAVNNLSDIDSRQGMALGQYIAGMGFSNVGLGIVHSMAHQLGAYYDTPHGVANALLLPYVMEYNAEAAKVKYRQIARAMGVTHLDGLSDDQAAQAAINAVKTLSLSIGIPQKLVEIGAKEEDLETLAKAAYNDPCTPGNPRDTSIEEILEIYKTALK